MQTSRPNKPQLDAVNGPQKVTSARRNIILHPIARSGGVEMKYWIAPFDVSFSQSPGTREPYETWPQNEVYGPWTWFEENKSLNVNVIKYPISICIINVTGTVNLNDSQTVVPIYLDANAGLYFQVQDQKGRMLEYPNVFWSNIWGAGSGGSTTSCQTLWNFYNVAISSYEEAPVYPTKYRWMGRMAGNVSMNLAGNVLIRYTKD